MLAVTVIFRRTWRTLAQTYLVFLSSCTHWPRHTSHSSAPAHTGTAILVHCCAPRRAGGCCFSAFLRYAWCNRCLAWFWRTIVQTYLVFLGSRTHWPRHTSHSSAPAHVGAAILVHCCAPSRAGDCCFSVFLRCACCNRCIVWFWRTLAQTYLVFLGSRTHWPRHTSHSSTLVRTNVRSNRSLWHSTTIFNGQIV